jgi:hypothetical protein
MTIQTLMASPQFWIGLVGAVLFGIWAYSSSKVSGNKVGKFPKVLAVILLLLATLAFLWVSNIGTLVGMSSAFSVGGVPESQTNEPLQNNLIDGKCLTADTTTVTLSAQDKYLATPTGGYHRYRINGNPALTVADAGTFSASPGDKIAVLWMNGSKTSAFSVVGNYIVPCAGTATLSEKLSNNASLTIRFFNSNNDLIDGATVNQTMVAGDIKNVATEIEGSYQKDYPYGFVAVIEFNKTSVDDVQLTQNGVEITSVAIPQSHSTTLGADSSRKAYLISEVNSNSKLQFTTVVDADDSTNPQAGAGSDVLLTLYPRNYFVNDKNGGAFEGPSAEDEYNAVTRTGTQAGTLYLQ